MSLSLSRGSSGAPPLAASHEPLLTPPAHVRDELVWELVRDEWDLLLAIGSGPTTVAQAAKTLGIANGPGLAKRVALLERYGLVADREGGYRLVPAFYERREGMSSYLRDLVLRRLQEGAAPPLAGGAVGGLGGAAELEAFIERAERELFPPLMALANRPESEDSQRFSLFFAVGETSESLSPAPQAYDGKGFRDQLLNVLKAAATAKSLTPDTRSAYLWVAEMRADFEVAVEIGDLFDQFLEAASRELEPSERSGAAAFAVLPASSSTSQRPDVVADNEKSER